MPIRRCTEQTRGTLEEFYREISDREGHALLDPGKGMLALIDIINQLFQETMIYGLTSHYRLILKNTDEPARYGDYVIISSHTTDSYFFEYLLPATKSPWEFAYVRGEANSLEQAKKYLLIAMRESEGWINNLEIEQALNSL